MATLAELIAERRAAIDKFKSDLYGHSEYDITALNNAIETTTIASKEDALAVIDLIRDEAAEPGQHLIRSATAALRRIHRKLKRKGPHGGAELMFSTDRRPHPEFQARCGLPEAARLFFGILASDWGEVGRMAPAPM